MYVHVQMARHTTCTKGYMYSLWAADESYVHMYKMHMHTLYVHVYVLVYTCTCTCKPIGIITVA